MTSNDFSRALRKSGVCLAAGVVFACGVSDRKVNEGSVAGSGGNRASAEQGGANSGGKPGNMPGSGGTGTAGKTDGAGQAGEIGAAGETGEAGAAGAPPVGCIDDSLRCADNTTPSKCVAGIWVDQEPCSAAKPACSNGVCAAATLFGGVVTVADSVLSTSSVRLVEHGLEYTQTTCGTVGAQKVCVTGGIRP
jgi:hypothetical protein